MMRDNEIVKMCYNFQTWNDKNNIIWAALLKHKLGSTGLDYIWIQDVRNATSIVTRIHNSGS
jgi:hypothetical protein